MSDPGTLRSEAEEAPPPSDTARFVIPPGTIYRELRGALFVAAGLFLLYSLAEPISAVLLFFLLMFIVAAVLNPAAVRLQAWGVPRMISAVGLVLLLLTFVVLIGGLAVPPLLNELGNFFHQFDDDRVRYAARYQEILRRYPELAEILPSPAEVFRSLSINLTALLGHLGRYTLNLAVGVMSLLLLVVLLVYTVGNPEPLIAGLLGAVPERYRDRVTSALQRIMEQLTNWAFGSIAIGIIVGSITGIGLHLLGVPHALLFGVIAAVGELIVTLGPILAAIPPLLLVLTTDPLLALWVAVLFIVIQQLESHVISPLVFGKRLDLHPVSLIFTILVMHALFGLLGALLAVPVCAILKVCWEEFYLKPRQTDQAALRAVASAVVNHRIWRFDRALDAATEDRIADGEANPDHTAVEHEANSARPR